MTVGRGAVLVLSRKPLRRRPIHEWLDDAAERVWLVTTKAALDGCGPEVGGAFAGLATVEDYRSWDVELRAEEFALRSGAALVASSSEDDVLRAARLRHRLGLPGHWRLACRLASRDKLVMKEAARAAGIAVPAFAPVDSPLDLLAFVEEHGFPVVADPAGGPGPRASTSWPTAGPSRPCWPPARCRPRRGGRAAHGRGLRRGRVPPRRRRRRRRAGGARLAEPVLVWQRPGRAGARPLTSHLLGARDPDRATLDDLTRGWSPPCPPRPCRPASTWRPGSRRGAGALRGRARTGGAFVADTYERAFGVHLSRESLVGRPGRCSRSTTDRRPRPLRRLGGADAGAGHVPPPAGPVPGRRGDRRPATGRRGVGAGHRARRRLGGPRRGRGRRPGRGAGPHRRPGGLVGGERAVAVPAGQGAGGAAAGGRRVAVLARKALTANPYAAWLAGADVVLFAQDGEATRRKLAGDHGYAAARRFPDWKRNRAVDLAVVDAHRERPLDRLVAQSECDQVRAGPARPPRPPRAVGGVGTRLPRARG